MSNVDKIAFVARYGSDKHRSEISDKIHSVIDQPGSSWSHPAENLINDHSHLLNDDHWHKIAKHANTPLVSRAMDHQEMPGKHLMTVAHEHPDERIRKRAKSALEADEFPRWE